MNQTIDSASSTVTDEEYDVRTRVGIDSLCDDLTCFVAKTGGLQACYRCGGVCVAVEREDILCDMFLNET